LTNAVFNFRCFVVALFCRCYFVQRYFVRRCLVTEPNKKYTVAVLKIAEKKMFLIVLPTQTVFLDRLVPSDYK
jgi:hypothetical protein